MNTLRAALVIASVVQLCTFAPVVADESSEPPQRECFDFAPVPSEPIIPASHVTVEASVESPPPYPRSQGHTPAHYPRDMKFEVTLDSSGTVTRVCGPPNIRDTRAFCESLGNAKYVPARVDGTPVATVMAVKFTLQ